MARLFISHSSKDSGAAVAFKQWLAQNGWPEEDVFLDLEDIGGGERWKDALRKAHARCEAVILLASPDALASPECLTEVRKAEDFGKEIVVVLLRDLTIEDRRLDSYKDRQIVDLSAPPQTYVQAVTFRGESHEIHFNAAALEKVKTYLTRRGIMPESFPWPPEGRPDAEPFPGLNAFTEQDAAIFFGRDADILTGLDEFRLMRRKGSPRFLAIQAGSGAGKSSYLRAGLWPRLARDADFSVLAILRPAQGILTGPGGLAQQLAGRLSRPGAVVNPGDIHVALMAPDAEKAAAAFLRFMTTAAEQAHDRRRIGDREAAAPALVIAIDQAEELLAPDHAEESKRLLLLLSGLMREPPPGVDLFGMLTVRADAAPRLFAAMAELGFEVPKTLTLLPLPRTSYRDVIVKPIEVLARRGEKITISAALADRLVADAAGPDALPLLAFMLLQLYKGFGAGGSLTLEQYEALGGVAGSIQEAIKAALARPGDAPVIPSSKEEQLAALRATFIPWLTRIDLATGEPIRRVARMDEFTGGARAMVERLIEKRLLISDRRGEVEIVEVAHESLLRQWPPLTAWLQAVADDLHIVDAVERAAGEWVRNARHPAWLDHRADRLSAAERVARQEDFRRRFGATGLEYLSACRAREARQRRIAQTIAWSAAAVFAVFAALSFYQWQRTLAAQKETQASLWIAQSELDLNNGNVTAAVEVAARAFASVPAQASRSALLQAAMEISPHLAAAIPFGAGSLDALAWMPGDALEVAVGARLRTVSLSNPGANAGGVALPVTKRVQDGNPATVRLLAPLGSGRTIVVFDQGSVGIFRSGPDSTSSPPPQAPPPVQPPPEPAQPPEEISIGALQSAVAVGPSGKLIAVATADQTVLLYRCDWNAPAPKPACASTALGEARGRVVAISRDETRVAVGDAAGTVTVYDLSGTALGSAKQSDAPITALGFAAQRDWLAVGTVKGEVAVLDAGAGLKPIGEPQSFGTDSIAALAWSPRDPILAFACNRTAVCLWQSGADADHPLRPAMRFEGHANTVTRLAFAPDGSKFASADIDGKLLVFTLAPDTGTTFALFGSEDSQISTVAASRDGRFVAGGSIDGPVEVWDAKTGASVRFIKPAEAYDVNDLAWNRKGAVAAIRANDTVEVIPADANTPTTRIRIKSHAGYHLAWADQDRRIAVPMVGSGVILLDPAAPDAAPAQIGEADSTEEAWGVASVPGSSLLLVSYVGGEIRIWDLASRQTVGSLVNQQTGQGDKIGIGSMSVSPDGRRVAVSSGNRFVTVYDIAKRAVWQTLKTDAAGILAVAISPDGQKLAALGSDKRLYVWTLGQDSAELYLVVGVVLRRAVVGDAARRSERPAWLDWISNDRIAVANGIAALSVIGTDPAQWLARINALALAGRPPI